VVSQLFAHKFGSNAHFRRRAPWGILAAIAMASLVAAAPAPAHAQAAAEYGGATGVSAGVTASRPGLFQPGQPGQPNNSLFLAKPVGPTPQQINRNWFAKKAGKKGAQLTIDATPAHSSIWIDRKFVGYSPLKLTLPAGKHHISLLGPRQEHAKRDVTLVAGKKRRIDIHLRAVYPTAVSIRVFGNSAH
jgi:hypothetical protein